MPLSSNTPGSAGCGPMSGIFFFMGIKKFFLGIKALTEKRKY